MMENYNGMFQTRGMKILELKKQLPKSLTADNLAKLGLSDNMTAID